MCTVLLPPGVNPIAVNKYININIKIHTSYFPQQCILIALHNQYRVGSPEEGTEFLFKT